MSISRIHDSISELRMDSIQFSPSLNALIIKTVSESRL